MFPVEAFFVERDGSWSTTGLVAARLFCLNLEIGAHAEIGFRWGPAKGICIHILKSNPIDL